MYTNIVDVTLLCLFFLWIGVDEATARAAQAPWHFLYFLPDPHQQGSLRPICSPGSTRRCSIWTGAACSSGMPPTSPGTAPPAAAAIAIAPWGAPPPPE